MYKLHNIKIEESAYLFLVFFPVSRQFSGLENEDEPITRWIKGANILGHLLY